MTDWLHDSDGNVRRELYAQGDDEILQRAAEIDRQWATKAVPLWAHQVFVDPTRWAIAKGTDGWLTVIRFHLHAQEPFVLCAGPRGGGFIGLDMITKWRTLSAEASKSVTFYGPDWPRA
jgi:hypothetical protein